MTAKKATRITNKMLMEEINFMKEEVKKVNDLEKRVSFLEQKISESEEELKKNMDSTEKVDIAENKKKCTLCEISFSSRKLLRKHLSETHQSKIDCTECKEAFVKTSDLEAHIKVNHAIKEEHSCDQCGKMFALKWRLKKHREGHENSLQKHCHYFNNGKSCPYEEIGCMFKHEVSKSCVFGQKCKNTLCQFKHTEAVENENVDHNAIILTNNFENLPVMEQCESKEILCDLYCKASYGYHVCSNDEFAEFVGCDVININDEYINDEDGDEIMVTKFPCGKCEERFNEVEILMEHFSKQHTVDKSIKCRVNKCKFSAGKIDLIKMHIGIDHSEEVKKRM